MLAATSIHGVGEDSWQTGEWQSCDAIATPDTNRSGSGDAKSVDSGWEVCRGRNVRNVI